MSELALVAAATNPATAPVVIPAYLIYQIIQMELVLMLAQQTARIAAQETVAATVTTAAAPFPVVGWIIGGVTVGMTAVGIGYAVSNIVALNAAKDLIKAGRFYEALSKLKGSQRKTILKEILKKVPKRDYPTFLQGKNQKWSNIVLTTTGTPQTMAQIGCYITSMASALTKMGHISDPTDLVTILKNNNKIASDGTLEAEAFKSFNLTQVGGRDFSFDKVLTAHAEGKIVIVENRSGHFMLMTGIDIDANICVMDPAGVQTFVNPDEIKGVRIYKQT